MRLLTHGPAWWCKSAYGIQLMHLHDMLIGLGHSVAQSCSYGFGGRGLDLNGITMLSHGQDGIGNDVIVGHAGAWNADAVISLGDVFMYNPHTWGTFFKWIPWVTVDSAPLWPDIKAALQNAHSIISYSRYAQDVFEEAGIDAEYIPLCFDPDVFYPGDMSEARDRLRFDQDRFIVSMVQANRALDDRKNFGGQITAFREFQLSNPDAFLYLHTCIDTTRGGIPLVFLLDNLGMVEGKDYTYVHQHTEVYIGASDDMMRDTYLASNVLLQCTRAEAFGVPQLEANACGRPVIHTDHGANKEVAHGYPVEYERRWHAAGSWYCQPKHDAMVEALNKTHRMRDRLLGDESAFVNHAQPYRKQEVFEKYWKPFIGNLEQEPVWESNLTLDVVQKESAAI